MTTRMKARLLILDILGFIMILAICILVNQLESRKPERDIRESIKGVSVYGEENRLEDVLKFDYRSDKHYILTYKVQSPGRPKDILAYYRSSLEGSGWEFTGKSDMFDHSNNWKMGEQYNFKKGKYELLLDFMIQEMDGYKGNTKQEPLEYSITIYPKS
ncbi:hypothetical protein [Dialister sp.]|jgi:hypothetical protein|uniref:hypothetical protein n=1 Tax=Dialister sp. TaxID=1955814 RepID=UPI003A5BE220